MPVTEVVGRQLPRVFAQIVSNRAKHAALNHHAAMKLITPVQAGETFNR